MLSQARLNIEEKTRTSRLPWRGQFSPEFVEYLMNEVCAKSSSYLDPFCGSGTVLFEATLRGSVSWGAEVNPAAWLLASLSEFAQLPKMEKSQFFKMITSLGETYNVSATGELFSPREETPTFLDKIAASDCMSAKLMATVLLLGMGNSSEFNNFAIARGALQVSHILKEMLYTNVKSTCFLADARSLPLEEEVVEAVITSPPYINVFNYHQNYRPATELLGWQPLEAARSEIGSNRKHRMNRFLTVIQYCMDMSISLSEISRVMKTGFPIVIILGRKSKVLGCSFKNGKFVRDIMEESGAFQRFQFLERVFTNRFGEKIYEDVIIAEKAKTVIAQPEYARCVGVDGLKDALLDVTSDNRNLLEDAIDISRQVKVSPKFQLTIPDIFKGSC